MWGLSPSPPAAASLASCSFAHLAPQSATSLGPPVATLPRVASAWLPVSAPPTGLGECFFFISLVVRLPYSSIFCQFWLVLFLNCCCPSLGCARRHSVSTYASILTGSPKVRFKDNFSLYAGHWNSIYFILPHLQHCPAPEQRFTKSRT